VTVLIDSDVLIEVSRGRDQSILSRWADLSRSDALILFSPVNEAELWAGARPSEYDSLEALFGALACAPADTAVRRRAGDYLRRYRKSHGLELGDALIAATAVTHNATLWTRNRKHYPMKELSFFD
jgi:predicted nucleic acid-binding protein